MAKDYKYQVTVGMPVWGVEKYIKRCILSILNQDFDDMEVLVVDDCSPDKSIPIVEEIIHTHPKGNKIRIIRQQQNMGCWSARNRILDEALGKYIFLVDSDDFLCDGSIAKLFKKAEETQVEATYGSIIPVDEEGIRIKDSSVQGTDLPDMVLRGENRLAIFANDSLQENHLSNFIWNIMLSSEFIKTNRLRFRKTKFWDDVLFNADMQPLISSAAFISDYTYNYVIRDNSLSNFQARKIIQIAEVRQHIANHEYLKSQCLCLKGRPYYEIRMTKMMRQMFYVIAGIFRNESKLSAPISNREIRDAIHHPLSLKEIIEFKNYKGTNFLFWTIGNLPSSLSVFSLKIIAKLRHLI